MLDFLTTELNSRFDAAASHDIAEFMHLLSSQQATFALQKQQLSHILDVYPDDLPCIRSLEAKLQLWHRKWEVEDTLAKELDTPEKFYCTWIRIFSQILALYYISW